MESTRKEGPIRTPDASSLVEQQKVSCHMSVGKKDQQIDSTFSWEEFITPELLRGKLISASLYLTVFQMLKDCIVDRIKCFYAFDSNASTTDVNQRYESDVLMLNKSRVFASLKWLLQAGAIQQADLDQFEKLKLCRNKLAHDLASVSLGTSTDHLELFPSMVQLLSKVERWWILNVYVPSNPEFDGVQIDEEDVDSARVMMVRIMADVAIGSDSVARKYLEVFRQHRT
jgi:hypothetical protein